MTNLLNKPKLFFGPFKFKQWIYIYDQYELTLINNKTIRRNITFSYGSFISSQHVKYFRLIFPDVWNPSLVAKIKCSYLICHLQSKKRKKMLESIIEQMLLCFKKHFIWKEFKYHILHCKISLTHSNYLA